MRELLLTADLEELKGEGAGPLAEHLRGCAACRADAARIVRSTARLGEAVSSRHRRRTAAILTPFALAAGVVLFVMTHPTTTVDTPAAGASIAGAPVVAAPSPAPLQRANTTAASVKPRPQQAASPIDAVAITAVAFVPPKSFVAEPLRGTSAEDHDAPGSRQPTLLHSSDPDITVLWFQ